MAAKDVLFDNLLQEFLGQQRHVNLFFFRNSGISVVEADFFKGFHSRMIVFSSVASCTIDLGRIMLLNVVIDRLRWLFVCLLVIYLFQQVEALAIPTHPYTHRGQPQHRELYPLFFSNSVWVL